MASDSALPAQESVMQAAWRACITALLAVAGFSLCINLLMLAGPLYMLQIYDRVLVSRSVPTLVALSAILAALFFAYGILENVRGRLMNRVAGRLNGTLGPALLDAILNVEGPPSIARSATHRDLANVRQFLSSPGPVAFFDMPWVPVYLVVVFIMHWVLGLVALAGALLMLALALSTDRATRRHNAAATDVAVYGQRMITEATRSIDAILAMGMKRAIAERWVRVHDLGEFAQRRAVDRIAGFSAATTTLRLVLQSALLGIGAYLAIQDRISPVMIEAAIITGRALAPVGQIVSHWRSFLGALDAYQRLRQALEAQPAKTATMPLPRPAGWLEVAGLYAAPPGAKKPVLHGIEFTLEPGESLGIIGPSASGKSTLARTLVGLWPAKHGTVRLDGNDVAHWDRGQLGPWIGYLPQEVELIEGTVRDNICRFQTNPDPEAIIEAARLVGVHDLVQRLPNGYDTKIGAGGRFLSAGQRQRIALARAVYDRPTLVVLDEPNSNLDAEGDTALSAAIKRMKKAGTTTVVVAHRPSAIAVVDKILVLVDGRMRRFGPREEVLRLLQSRAPAPPVTIRATPEGMPHGWR